MNLNRDDIRAAVATGTITEAQAASILALAEARAGLRDRMSGLDEPFELFKGFNEIFIVVGLTILYGGWAGFTGLSVLFSGQPSSSSALLALVGMGVLALLARYFTLTRRMVAPSIALTIMFGLSATQLGASIGAMVSTMTPIVWSLTSAIAGLCLLLYWVVFRVPFAMLLIAISVFATTFALTLVSGASLLEAREMFLLTGTGFYSLITIGLGVVGLIVALAFDFSDPHRVTRRAQNGFWLHIIAAPAIVNTIALTLFQEGTVSAQLILVAFLTAMALFAIIIDRRSFLVAGIGYVVALAFTVVEDNFFLVILLLGAVLVLLGAQWERMRGAILRALPDFPGKTRLPPYASSKDTT